MIEPAIKNHLCPACGELFGSQEGIEVHFKRTGPTSILAFIAVNCFCLRVAGVPGYFKWNEKLPDDDAKSAGDEKKGAPAPEKPAIDPFENPGDCVVCMDKEVCNLPLCAC